MGSCTNKNSNWSGKTCYILSQLMVMEFPRLNDGEDLATIVRGQSVGGYKLSIYLQGLLIEGQC